MEANWFPEHLEAGAKVFEAEIATHQSSPTKSPSETLTILDGLRYYLAELRKFKAEGSVSVKAWLQNDSERKIKMTAEGARQMSIFRKHMKLSVGVN